VVDAFACGISQIPRRVTMPMFDWVNRPSRKGPTPYGNRWVARVAVVPEAGFQQLAAGQHHLHPGHVLQAVAVGRVAEAALHDIADVAGVGPGAGAVGPQRVAALAQVADSWRWVTPGSMTA
jgi:hypothetical protein